jgi:hypothetical protein
MTPRPALATHRSLNSALLLLLALAWLTAVLGPAVLGPAVPAAEARPPDKSLVWEAYDVDLVLDGNGDLRVTETQRIRFTSGSFTFGFAAIPMGRTEGIDQVQVREDDGPVYEQSGSERDYTYKVEREDDELLITWYFPSIANATRTYVLSYTARRVVRVGAAEPGVTCATEGDIVNWYAIAPDHNFPIRSARVTLNLPAPVKRDAEGAYVSSYGAAAEGSVSESGSQVTWTAREIGADEPLEICAVMPAGTVTSGPPDWQQVEQETVVRDRVMQTVALVIALPVLIGGPLAVLGLYYTRGRDPEVGLVAEYLSEPPGPLPPGVAGTLVDEQADLQDVIATLVDLARRGHLMMEEEKGGILRGADFVFRRQSGSDTLRPYERILLDKVFRGDSERRLSQLKNKFYSALPALQEMLYDEVVQAGYYKRSPESVRATYAGCGGTLLGLALVGGFVLLVVLESGWLLCPLAAVALFGALLLIAARAMPVRTRPGAEEAGKWRAFKRYLANIEKYTDLSAAKEQFERYLPYAVAFGLERSWISRFARVPDMPPPIWYRPLGYYPAPYGHRPAGSLSTAAGAGGGRGRPEVAAGEGGGLPSLGEASSSMAGGLAGMSAGLSNMLSTTGRVMTSTPAPKSSGSSGSRGGFGGGGFSGGGGGGGGSRGFG